MSKPKKQIQDWLDQYEITNYTINDDLTVDVNWTVDLSCKELTEIPVQFNLVNGNFSIENNKLSSLEGCPIVVKGHFWCEYNNLKSLKYCPRIVRGDFVCHSNNLLSLEYSPEIVLGNFYCRNNKSLKSLKGLNLKGLKNKLIVNEDLQKELSRKPLLLS